MKNFYKKIYFFILEIWEKSATNSSQISFFKKKGSLSTIVFYFLVFCEFFYRGVFFLSKSFRKIRGGYEIPGTKIISVGNLSVGGTGKSVVVSYLIKKLQEREKTCAVLLRGYRRNSSKKKNVILLDGEQNNFFNLDDVGDEAHMLFQKLRVPVGVGKNRKISAQKIKNIFLTKKTDNFEKNYFVLDDGYQNYQLKKDCEILLIDSRYSVKNGRCLPAGFFREKDFSRADVIIFTHADKVKKEILCDAKNWLIKQKFCPSKIFFGRHAVSELVSAAGIFAQRVEEKKRYLFSFDEAFKEGVFGFAGIGSFDNFVFSLKSFLKNFYKIDTSIIEGDTFFTKKFPDHHVYTKKDLRELYEKSAGAVMITTSKDWQKLEPLLRDSTEFFVKDFIKRLFILEIGFEFLSFNMEDDAYLKSDVFEEKKFCNLVI